MTPKPSCDNGSYVERFAALFPEGDYRHHLSLKRGDPARFYAPTAEHDAIIAERTRWLTETPDKYAAANGEAAEAIAETAAMLREWGTIDDTRAEIVEIGKRIEPDIVLLTNRGEGFRVVAGCVCFPSSWDFSEKMGMPLHSIHDIVPDLNPNIGATIAKFLEKIQPGASWERSNWGLSSSPERNQHPSRGLNRLVSPAALAHTWLRVEDQILTILPKTKALLFGIRIVTFPLSDLPNQSPTRARLRNSLTTMSDAMLRYKNVSGVRDELVELLA